MSADSYSVPDGMTADKLRHIARSLELLAALVDKHLVPHLGEKYSDDEIGSLKDWLEGTEMQDDLRAWADALSPATDGDNRD